MKKALKIIGILCVLSIIIEVTGIGDSSSSQTQSSAQTQREATQTQQRTQTQQQTTQTPKETQTQQQTAQTPKETIMAEAYNLTEQEHAFFQTVSPYISEILEKHIKISKIMNQTETYNDWRNTTAQLAQDIINIGIYIRDTRYPEEVRPLGDPVVWFSVCMIASYTSFSEWLVNNDAEEIEIFNLGINDAICFLNEIKFYIVHGTEVSKYVKACVSSVIDSDKFISANIDSGTKYLYIPIYSDDTQDLEELKTNSLIDANNILWALSQDEYLNYIDVTITVNYKFDDKEVTFMKIEFTSDTRSKINFDSDSWINIPDLADNYESIV